jgi:signal peptidase I
VSRVDLTDEVDMGVPPEIVAAPPPAVIDADAQAWSDGAVAVAATRGPSGRARKPARATEGRRRTRAVRRSGRVRTFLTWAGAGLVVGLAAVVVLPGMLGYHSLTVLSGSMEPTIHVGDVVVERSISPLDARIGDIVTFRDPGDQHILITHRVRSVHVAAGTVHFTTKGDANNTVEHWAVPTSGSIGLVRYHIQRLGFALVWGSSRNGRLALVVLPTLLLGVYELVRIWRPKGSRSGAIAG